RAHGAWSTKPALLHPDLAGHVRVQPTDIDELSRLIKAHGEAIRRVKTRRMEGFVHREDAVHRRVLGGPPDLAAARDGDLRWDEGVMADRDRDGFGGRRRRGHEQGTDKGANSEQPVDGGSGRG